VVNSKAVKVEAIVQYHLLDEAHRKRINYKNITPISYEIFHRQIVLSDSGRTHISKQQERNNNE